MAEDAYLSIVAIVKDEARYLPEWLTFHEAVGVEQFYIYDNGSTDATSEILAARRNVTVYDWPGDCQQLNAYANGLQHYDSTWLAFLDIDEFLFSPEYLPLPTVLKRYERHDGIGVCWATYGTSDRKTSAESTLRAYLQRAEHDNPVNRHIKSIVQPRRIPQHRPPDPHHWNYALLVDTEGRPLQGPFAQSVTWARLRINHYWSRSIEEVWEKAGKPRADNGELRQVVEMCSQELNLVRDDAILPYADLVQRRLQ